jgi:hypothetical protein
VPIILSGLGLAPRAWQIECAIVIGEPKYLAGNVESGALPAVPDGDDGDGDEERGECDFQHRGLLL